MGKGDEQRTRETKLLLHILCVKSEMAVWARRFGQISSREYGWVKKRELKFFSFLRVLYARAFLLSFSLCTGGFVVDAFMDCSLSFYSIPEMDVRDLI